MNNQEKCEGVVVCQACTGGFAESYICFRVKDEGGDLLCKLNSSCNCRLFQ